MSDKVQHLLESWPVALDRPFHEGTAVYDTRQYLHAAPTIQQNGYSMTPTNKYYMVAPTPVEEMQKWIGIVEEGLKKKPKQSMLTEPVHQQQLARNENMLSEPLMRSELSVGESVLHEVDPITRRQNVDMIQDTSVNVNAHTHDHSRSLRTPVSRNMDAVMAKTEATFKQVNQMPQWKEIDPVAGTSKPATVNPITGEPIPEPGQIQEDDQQLAGWKIL